MRKDKQEKEQEKLQELMEKYGLQNMQNAEDKASVAKILEGTLEFGDVEKGYLRTLIGQNFIIIRQLDRAFGKAGEENPHKVWEE